MIAPGISLVDVLENALFVHVFGYMLELKLQAGALRPYMAISNWFELTTCFLTFIVILIHSNKTVKVYE